MAQVKMRTYISGGRGDGTDWPAAGEVLTCGDDEARHLVRADLAQWHDAEPAAGGAEPDDGGFLPAAPADDVPEPEDGFEDDGEPDSDPNRPSVRAPKQDWIDYATTYRGLHPLRAAEMTKSDLLGEFGKPKP